MRTTCVLLVLAAAPALAADPKPDFTVEAEAFAKEAREGMGVPFRKKYSDKVIEVTGTVQYRETYRPLLVLNGDKGVKGKVVDIDIRCDLPKGAGDPLLPLAKGQQVTVRGRQHKDATGPILLDCEVVKTGPSPAMPVTLGGILGELRADEKATRKKYYGKPVVVRVKVVEAKVNGTHMTWAVIDPDAKGDPTGYVAVDYGLDDDLLKHLQKVKPGHVIVVLANDTGPGTPTLLNDAVLLKEPPPGVKLPGDKK